MGKMKKFKSGFESTKSADKGVESDRNNKLSVANHPIRRIKRKIGKKSSLIVENETKSKGLKLQSSIYGTEEEHCTSQFGENKIKNKSKSNKFKEESVESPSPIVENTKSIKHKKKFKSVETKVAESINRRGLKKRKKKIMNDPSFLENKNELKIEEKKVKKNKLLSDESNINLENSASNIKPKNEKLKNLNSPNETVKCGGKETGLKPKKELKKAKSSINNSESDSPKENRDGRDSRTIFVGNVPLRHKKKKLLKLFEEKGQVEKMWIRGIKPLSDKISKKTAFIANLLPKDHPPVVSYVLFKTAAEASKALELNGALFDDHRLRVTFAHSKLFPLDKGVFVGNLPLNTTDDDLFDMFSECGDIMSVRIARNFSGIGRGIGYVNFQSADAVELALKLNREKVRGREIRVQRLQNNEKLKKIRNQKMKNASKAVQLSQKHEKNQTEGKLFSDKSSDEFKKKYKNSNSAEFKKKILAKKLTSTTKRN